MTTHELAKKLLNKPDELIGCYHCRICHAPIREGEKTVGTGATHIGEGCYTFHKSCLDGVSLEARLDLNKVTTPHFENPKLYTVILWK